MRVIRGNLAAAAAARPLHRRGRKPEQNYFAQIVAVGFRDDLPAVAQFHRHQIVGEIARRQLAAHLDEGGLIIGAVDRDDEILARLAFGFGGRPLPHPVQPAGK